MSSAAPSLFRRVVLWFRRNWRHVLLESGDFRLATVTWIVVFVGCVSSPALREGAVGILITQAGIGVAVLGVVLTALAILVGLLDQHYLHVLEKADDEGLLDAAFQPYRVTATIAGTAALVGLFAAATWEIPGLGIAWLFRSIAFASSSALSVWAISGTVQLVTLTAWHGSQRGYLMRGIREARRQADKTPNAS